MEHSIGSAQFLLNFFPLLKRKTPSTFLYEKDKPAVPGNLQRPKILFASKM
jgi:hypothetical protein